MFVIRERLYARPVFSLLSSILLHDNSDFIHYKIHSMIFKIILRFGDLIAFFIRLNIGTSAISVGSFNIEISTITLTQTDS
jgi:hypothetical protein